MPDWTAPLTDEDITYRCAVSMYRVLGFEIWVSSSGTNYAVKRGRTVSASSRWPGDLYKYTFECMSGVDE